MQSGTARPNTGLPQVLSALLGVLAAVPIGTGVLGITGGPELGPDGAAVVYFGSEYQFFNCMWLSVGIALLWSLRRPRTTRLLLTAIIFSTLCRLVPVALAGWPPPVFGIALATELFAVPLLLDWCAASLRAPAIAA